MFGQFDCDKTKQCSGFRVVANSSKDYSVKVLSDDGMKDVTLIRFAGPGASFAASFYYTLLKSLFEAMGWSAL